MMKSLLLCLLLGVSAQTILAQNNGCGQTFLKTLGAAPGGEYATGICAAPDGNYYIAGGRNANAHIMKITPEGDPLWAVEFQISTAANFSINDLKVDSDGKLFGCGVIASTLDGFVFRFDPESKSLLWLVGTDGLTPTDGIMEKPSNGNYVVFSNLTLGNSSYAGRFVEYARLNGQATGSLHKNYHFRKVDRFTSLTITADAMYASSSSIPGNFSNQSRQTISKFDLDGNEIWSVMGHIPADQPAQLVSRDLLLDQQSLITISSGNDVEDSNIKTFVFLQKNTLDGGLVWVKKFDLPEFSNPFSKEILNLPDGYLIFGRNSAAPSKLFFLKTDKDGNLIWAKKVTYPIQYGISATFGLPQTQVIISGNYIYAAVSALENNNNFDILLIKMNTDGYVSDDCGFVSNTEAMPLPVPIAENTPFLYTVSDVPETFFPLIIPFDSAALMPLITRCSTQASSFVGISKILSLCPGQSTVIGGADYTAPAMVQDTVPAINSGCDTIITYVLTLMPLPVRDEIRVRCPGEATIIGGIAYFAPDTVVGIIPATNGACDTVVTYMLTLAPVPTRSETRNLCPGETILIGGVAYTAPNTVLDTILAANGACDTLITYTLERAPQPTRDETRSLCPGETIQIGGVAYFAPNTVLDTIPATNGGCDTIVTYTLLLQAFPQPSSISLACPPSVTVNASNPTVNFPTATAATDCICDSVTLIRSSGLPSGSTFPIGVTEVCYRATDLCGTSKNCCFLVTVNADPIEPACDIKTIGCVKFELLGIQQNPALEKTYRVRVTNNCTNALMYAAFQLPDGFVATFPANNATYTTSGGRNYTVRNPNDAPFHSIRYKSLTIGIANGQSDIFSYTLPQQATPTYILSMVRLEPQLFYEAHLNTFNCPVQHTGSIANRTNLLETGVLIAGLRVFPNPSSGLLHVEFPVGSDHLEVLNAQGAQVLRADVPLHETRLRVELPAQLENGLYFLRVRGGGDVVGVRFVLER